MSPPLVTGIGLLLLVNAPVDKMERWRTPRRGANFMNAVETRDRLEAARAAGIALVRLAPNKWTTAARDFLLGDADGFVRLVPADLARLRTFLDDAAAQDVDVVLTTLSLPGSRWKQQNGERDDLRLWREPPYQEQAAAFWRELATVLRGHPALAGYDLLNEPHPERTLGLDDSSPNLVAGLQRAAGTTADLNVFNERLVKAIREVDPETPIVLEGPAYAGAQGMPALRPVSDPRVLYSFHMYEPYVYTNRKTNRGRFAYPGSFPRGEGQPNLSWDKAALEALLEPVRTWQATHGLLANRIVAAEFGCHRLSPGADRYLGDLVDLFERYGWHWAFYAFREDTWDGMDYERAPLVFDVLRRSLTRPTPSGIVRP
jgi:endoglucanase